MKTLKSSQLFQEAQKYIPGGVNSPVRAFKSVGGQPIFMKSAKGAYMYDENNNAYIDYINSWGPMILGHAYPSVVAAIQEQLNKGISFGTPTEIEVKIAKLVTEMVPTLDKIRMVNSGTEACMTAIRLARAYTEKNKIIKFEGCYHGHADSFLIQAGSGAATLGIPNSPGVTPATAQDTLTALYNDINSVKEIFDKNPNEIAAVIIEPVAGNMGCIPPKEDFLKDLKDLCDKNKSLLIFDEVMTGFRLAQGGAQELYGITADIVCYGKVIGGGMPVGAIAGKNVIMDNLAPLGNVYQAGTLSGNPLAMQAGYYTLLELKNNPTIYQEINTMAEELETEITFSLNSKGIPFQFNRVQSMFSLFFTNEKVVDYKSAKKADNNHFKKFFHKMLENGIYIPPSSYESWFVSHAITPVEVEKTMDAFNKSISKL